MYVFMDKVDKSVAYITHVLYSSLNFFLTLLSSELLLAVLEC